MYKTRQSQVKLQFFQHLGENRQPSAIFQVPFFLGKQTIQNQKTNIVASQYRVDVPFLATFAPFVATIL